MTRRKQPAHPFGYVPPVKPAPAPRNPFANIPNRGELTGREISGPFTPTLPPSALTAAGLPPTIASPTPGRTTSSPLSTSPLVSAISALLSPGPALTPREVAEAAHTLGVQPRTTVPAPSALKDFGASISHLLSGTSAPKLPSVPSTPPVPAFKPTGPTPKIRAAEAQSHQDFLRENGGASAPVDRGAAKAQPVSRNPADPLGKKTLGNVTLPQLKQAQQQGTLKINKKGTISTPVNRQALHQLLAARKAASRSQGDGSVEAQVGSYLRAHGLNRVGTAGILGNAFAESSFQPGAQGYGGGGLWGFTAHPNSLSDLQTYAATKGKSWEDPKVQADFLLQHVSPETIKAVNSAGTPEAAAAVFMEQFERPGIPRQGVREEAARSALGGSWGKPDPQAAQALQVAKQNARAVGINPTPFNGDVAGGGAGFSWVRADAKGMLDWAESALGITDSSPRTQRMGQRFGLNTVTQPWCANFVSNGLLRRGITNLPANPNYVPSFEEWAQEGKEATIVQGGLANAKPGDLVAFSGQHIGIYAGGGEMISGNFGNEVSRDPVSADSTAVSMIIRPKYKGGKVKVADSQVAGSSAASALGGVAGTESAAGTAASGSPQQEALQQRRQQALANSGSGLSISELLQPLSLTPNPGGEEEAGPDPEGTIARILRRKRL